MINSKIELILSGGELKAKFYILRHSLKNFNNLLEEQRYKSLHADFQKLSSLMKVLDDKTLNG